MQNPVKRCHSTLCFYAFVVLTLFCTSSFAQKNTNIIYTKADTIRGSLSALRTCYDVTFYDLQLSIDLKKRFIKGSNTIYFRVTESFDSLQIDLFESMKITKIISEAGTELKFSRKDNAAFIHFSINYTIGSLHFFTVMYEGVPQVAQSPPWDGGFVWKKDANNKDWVGVACEGTGASLWWPCKDHLSDEPDSMMMTYTIPSGLMCVSNGQLTDTVNHADGTVSWKWFVSYPINNYNVTLNIGDYAHFSDYFVNQNDSLPLDYYVLKYNLPAAKEHFQQVKLMLACFEKYFGNYPFQMDGYALVETNYWGMEHQGAIAYGNNYVNNTQGFDYIIIHESAHEWWGNQISAKDLADMWVHEAFATYAEVLYQECRGGYELGLEWLESLRYKIQDAYPIIGHYGVNSEGSGMDADMYYKGAWVIHTFRSVLNDDSLFFALIMEIQKHFSMQTITSDELIQFISQFTGKDYTTFWNQYLHYSSPPVFEYKLKKKGSGTKLTFRWKTDVKNFAMPVEITSSAENFYGKISSKFMRIHVTNEWQTIIIKSLDPSLFEINESKYYVLKRKVK